MCTDGGYCPLRKACGAGAVPHREGPTAANPAAQACGQQVCVRGFAKCLLKPDSRWLMS